MPGEAKKVKFVCRPGTPFGGREGRGYRGINQFSQPATALPTINRHTDTHTHPLPFAKKKKENRFLTPGLGQLSSALRHTRRRKRRERAAAASRVPGPEARRSCLLTELPGVLQRPGPRRLALRRPGVYLQPRHAPQPLGTPCPGAH